MRNLRSVVTFLLLVVSLAHAHSAAADERFTQGRITGVIVNEALNVFVFRVEVVSSTAKFPACATTERFAMPLGASGKASPALATVLLAYAMGTQVNVRSALVCDTGVNNSETASYVCLGDIGC